jgi:hypothetical protein
MDLPELIAEMIVSCVSKTSIISLGCVNRLFYRHCHARLRTFQPHIRCDLLSLHFTRCYLPYDYYIACGLRRCSMKARRTCRTYIENMDSTNNEIFTQTFKYNDIKLSKWCLSVLYNNLDRLYLDSFDAAQALPEYTKWILTVLPKPHREHIVLRLLRMKKFDALIDIIDFALYTRYIFEMPADVLDKLCTVVGYKKIAILVTTYEFLYSNFRTDTAKFLIYICDFERSELDEINAMISDNNELSQWLSAPELIFPKYMTCICEKK